MAPPRLGSAGAAATAVRAGEPMRETTAAELHEITAASCEAERQMDLSQLGLRHPPPSVAVIGAGLVGLTSAHALSARGYHVTVIDRQPHVANECSFANAALLMRSYSRPKTATMCLPSNCLKIILK